ncbi:MAG: restriction endonuclease subunit S [Krumholzibacteria bacterium]|nr:restriction endonuclease subunit S [Candidatus Krumholzibacteria bacterium]
MKYSRYSDSRDTGFAHIGTVPSHWNVERAKFLFRRMSRPVRDSDGIVTAFRDGQVTLRKNRREDGFTNAVKEIGYQGIRKGDLVIHAMDGFAGAIGVSDSDGKSSPVYSACVPVRADVIPGYYALLIRDLALNGFVESLAKGVRERSSEFRFAEVKELALPVPSVEEQITITGFLDRETAKIDTLIEKQEQLIKLLDEKRQTVISHAVTKGLNPDVRMKDSGVEWLGEVPEHWHASYVKHWLRSSPCYGVLKPDKHEGDDGVPLIRTMDVQDRKVLVGQLDRISPELSAEYRRTMIQAGDLVVSVVGTIGRTFICTDDHRGMNLSRALARLQLGDLSILA